MFNNERLVKKKILQKICEQEKKNQIIKIEQKQKQDIKAIQMKKTAFHCSPHDDDDQKPKFDLFSTFCVLFRDHYESGDDFGI